MGLIAFDDVTVDTDGFRVLKSGRAVELEPKGFAVLLALLERPGVLVTKEQLLATVWPDTFVAPNTLTRIVAQLRRALGDSSRTPRIIETVHTRGYRFIAVIRPGVKTRASASGGLPPEALPASQLPARLSPLIGRDAALDALVNAFAISRLITLVGIGGVGKTQLALEVARRLAGAFADGVHVVDLAPYQAGTDVSSIVAATLDLGDEAGTDGSARVTRLLRERRCLLVLDNCEHLAASCADLAGALLAGCPSLSILATSQQPLGVSGESVVPVSPLALPEPVHADADVPLLEDVPSVRLFVSRARLAQPSFSLGASAKTQEAVVQICQRLDGIPLALEMAAARMSVLGAEQLAARLDDRFALLTDGRGTLGRHQTLRAAMDWSCALLEPAERELLERLSVFAGGWSLDAAESVCASDELSRSGLVSALAGLVARSFVSTEPLSDGYRYRLHETTRAYASGRLEKSGRTHEFAARHFDHVLALARAAERERLGSAQPMWLARLDAEQGNLAAAYEWALRDGAHGAGALRLASALRWYWQSRSRFVEARSWLVRAIQAARRVSRRERAEALVALASVEQTLLCQDDAIEHARQALALSRRGDSAVRAMAYTVLAVAAKERRQGAAAEREALRLADAAKDSWLIGSVRVASGLRAARLDQHRRAARQFADARKHLETTGDRWLFKYATIYEGLQRHLLGDQPLAASLIARGLEIATELQDRRATAGCLEAFAYIAVRRGALDLACRLLGAADALRHATGVPLAPPWTAINQAARAHLRRRLGRRETDAWARGRRAPLRPLIDEAESRLVVARRSSRKTLGTRGSTLRTTRG